MTSKEKKQIIHANRPYQFGPYSFDWSQIYEENAKMIREVLGNQIIFIEHIGSTSIPGMWAKPQIDMLVTVKNFGRIPEFYEQMLIIGYTAHGDYTKEGEEYFTKDTSEGIREVSIHILPDGHRWAVDLLDFRDYLRTHPSEVKYYATIKRKMNEKYPNDYTNYYKGKLQAIHAVRKRAAIWKGHELY